MEERALLTGSEGDGGCGCGGGGGEDDCCCCGCDGCCASSRLPRRDWRRWDFCVVVVEVVVVACSSGVGVLDSCDSSNAFFDRRRRDIAVLTLGTETNPPVSNLATFVLIVMYL